MTKTINLNNPLFQTAMPLLEAIESHGYEAYFVGGCVRDALLGKEIHDIDIATSATPDEIQGIFPVTFDVGKKHGTIVVVYKKENYEITTFRTEGSYSDRRRPDQVNFVRNLREDTLRRDFTINALALDRLGRVYDYHGGEEDLEAGIIRAVGTALERFDEDALRMMRALRFASQLGFEIEFRTLEAIGQLAPNLSYVSIERIRIELSKLMQGDYLGTSYKALAESGLCAYLLGMEQVDALSVWHQVYETLAAQIDAGISRDERLVWWALVKALGLDSTQARAFLRDWKHSNPFINDVSDLLELDQAFASGPLDAWQLYQMPTHVLAIYETYAYYQAWLSQSNQLTQAKAQLPLANRSDLAINGQKVMEALGLSRGNAGLGRLLLELECQVVMGDLPNEPAVLLAQAQALGADYLEC